MGITKTVRYLVRKYNTRNPLEIAEAMGILIVFYPLKGVRGFYHYFRRNHIIYIDESLPEHMVKLVCAHELGHMIYHRAANAVFMDTRTQFTTQKYELEADRFAVNLLISDYEIEEHLDFTTIQFSRLFGYNKQLIELRLRDFV
ncbi:MAG: ImmA/IrrE family metallo-endopeptidase [Ruminococcus sp.]|nr:ImmA/IrrE family metallo-endopeptidase [Ruminococcus sp.]